MNKSGIEWIRNDDGSKGGTINLVIGCSRISSGCGGGHIRGPNGEQGGCWAEELVSTRMSKNPKLPMYADLARPDGGWSGIVKLVPERLKEIVALGKARRKVKGTLEPFASRVFVCDLSDLFHDKVPFEYIAAVFGAMASAPNHLFYVLTKRPARAVEFARWLHDQLMDVGMLQCLAHVLDTSEYAGYFPTSWDLSGSREHLGETWPLPNVAFGVTVEDRRYGVPRLSLARQFPARYHWVSVEPQLEDLGDVDFTGFDLLVNGGEAGPDSRPFDLQWAHNIRDAARRANALYFFKQMGDRPVVNGWPWEAKKKGNVREQFPDGLRIRENLPMPGETQ